ncbi:Tenascin-like isoform X1 [Oopsacas minuta]|uniref:Tenascin-like isoform X1 n=1 Tax=Oopsacas minuta TaxID=111878 RepID=A0AAV7KC89_9METZ|nr:Tenascin-like isoform X1 [Oopsacas minuta]
MRLILYLLLSTLWYQIEAQTAPQICQSLGSVRLYNDMYPQLCSNASGTQIWNSFCGDFGKKEAKVFCKVLGFPMQDSATPTSMTVTALAIDNLVCMGDETTLNQCSYSELLTCSVTVLSCISCTNNSMCLGGQCSMNGKCVCLNDCENGGYCFLGKCLCSDGFGGPTCSGCDPQCENEGVCTANGTCQCMPSYSGERCEFNNTTVKFPSTNTSFFPEVVPTDSSLTLIIIAAAVPSLILSCTLIIICFGILACLAIMVCLMKPKFGRKTVDENAKMTVITEHSSEKSSYINSPQYELEFDISHNYCCIQDTLVEQNSSNPLVTIPVYNGNSKSIQPRNTFNESDRAKDDLLPDFPTNSTSDVVQRSFYVIDNMNDN